MVGHHRGEKGPIEILSPAEGGPVGAWPGCTTNSHAHAVAAHAHAAVGVGLKHRHRSAIPLLIPLAHLPNLLALAGDDALRQGPDLGTTGLS